MPDRLRASFLSNRAAVVG